MTRVNELMPGMKVNMPTGEQATFVVQTQHPLWPSLQLVVWKMPNDWPNDSGEGAWSHDALDPRQDIGTVVPSTPYEREVNLRAALLGERA
jgi:hypothetical protein